MLDIGSTYHRTGRHLAILAATLAVSLLRRERRARGGPADRPAAATDTASA